MPRKESEAVPESNGPVPQQEEFGSGQPTLADVYRRFKERFDQSDRYLDSMKSHLDQQEKKPGAGRSVDTSCHRGRRASRHQDSRAHEGRRYSNSSDAWG